MIAFTQNTVCTLIGLRKISRVVLLIGTFRAGVRETSADAVPDLISHGGAEAFAVLFLEAATVVGLIFAAHAAVLPVLQSKVQAVNQTEEVRVTVGGNAVSTGLQEVVGTVGVATEFRQNVGRSYVVNNAVVTTVVERTRVAEFQTREGQTSPRRSLELSVLFA